MTSVSNHLQSAVRVSLDEHRIIPVGAGVDVKPILHVVSMLLYHLLKQVSPGIFPYSRSRFQKLLNVFGQTVLPSHFVEPVSHTEFEEIRAFEFLVRDANRCSMISRETIY